MKGSISVLVWAIHVFFLTTPICYLFMSIQIREDIAASERAFPMVVQLVPVVMAVAAAMIGLVLPSILRRWIAPLNNPLVNTIASDICFGAAGTQGLILPFLGGSSPMVFGLIGLSFASILGNSIRVRFWLSEPWRLRQEGPA